MVPRLFVHLQCAVPVLQYCILACLEDKIGTVALDDERVSSTLWG